MTVSSELSRKTFTGDAVTTSFATSPMVFFDAEDLVVYVVTTATGAVVSTLTLDTHYTVSGGDGAVGTVSLAGGSSPYGAPTAAQTLVIQRDLALTQGADFVQNDGSDAEVAEDAHDRIMMIAQQLDTRIERSFKLADSDVSGVSTTLPTPEASTLIGWNSALTALVNYSAGELSDDILVSSFMETVLDDADADAMVQTLVDGATAETSPASGDIILLSDVSLTPDDGRKMTLGNVLKVVSDLTADALPVVTTDYLLEYDASAGAAKKLLVNDLPLPPKMIQGLTYSNSAGDTTNDIDVAVGAARDSTGADNLRLTSAITKRLDAAWAVGTGNGGILSGSAADVDYYIWLIKRSDTGVVDVGFETTANATPTLPTNYTHYRLIGWFKRVAGTIVLFHTYETEGGGIELAWDSPTLDINLANTLTTARRTDAVKVPLNFSVIADLNVKLLDASSNQMAYIYCPDRADLAPSSSATPLETGWSQSGDGRSGAFNVKIRTSATGTIAARSDLATVDAYQVATMGFFWARRN